MEHHKDYWFRTTRHGWGWHLSTAWQGWAVGLVYAAVVALLKWRLSPSHQTLFLGLLALATVLLALTCWFKGEPLSWPWSVRSGNNRR